MRMKNESKIWKFIKKVFFIIVGILALPLIFIFRKQIRSVTESNKRADQLNKSARETTESARTSIAESIESNNNTRESIEQCLESNRDIKSATDRAREIIEEIKKQPIKG